MLGSEKPPGSVLGEQRPSSRADGSLLPFATDPCVLSSWPAALWAGLGLPKDHFTF